MATNTVSRLFSQIEVLGTADISLLEPTLAALLLAKVDKINAPSPSGQSRQSHTPGKPSTLNIIKPNFGYEVVLKAGVDSFDFPGIRVLYGSASVANQLPSVSFNRYDSSTPTVNTTVQFVAVATDSDGSIKKTQLYRMANAATTNVADGELLDTDTTSPYMLSWLPTAAGNFPLRVLATDNNDATQFSAVLQVSVVAATAQAASITSTPASAMVGDVVTIPGSNFGAAPLLTGKVLFGTVPVVNFIHWSPTEILAIVPQGAQNGKISVLTADGQTAVSTNEFTVAVAPPLGYQQAAFDFRGDKNVFTNPPALGGLSACTFLSVATLATVPTASDLRTFAVSYGFFNLAIYQENYYFSIFTSDGEFHTYTVPTGEYAPANLVGKRCVFFGTYDGAKIRAYIKLPSQAPHLIAEQAATGTIVVPTENMFVGSWAGRTPEATIEQNQVWGKVLSEFEVDTFIDYAIPEPEKNADLYSYIVAEKVDFVTDPTKPYYEKSRFKQQINYSDPSDNIFLVGQTTLSLDPPALEAGPTISVTDRAMSVNNAGRPVSYMAHGGSQKAYTGPIPLNEQAQTEGKYKFWYEATPTSLRSNYSHSPRVEAATQHAGFPIIYLKLPAGRTISSLDATKIDYTFSISNGNGSNLDVSKLKNLTGKVARGGHSTFTLEKARMNLTFDVKQALIPGGYNDTDWVLMADARDPSFTNTTSALFLNNRSGVKCAKYQRYLVVDENTGIPQGTWVLVEKTKWAIVSAEKALATDTSIPMLFEKVAIGEEEPADLYRPNGAPGFFETPLYNNGAAHLSQYPKVKDLTDAYSAQEQSYLTAREDAIRSNDYATISQYVHIANSHANYAVQEFFRNYDFGHKSDLFYKLKNSLVSFAVGKDYDVAGAFRTNQSYLGGSHTPFVKFTPEGTLLFANAQYHSEYISHVLNIALAHIEATLDNMIEETRLLQCYGIPDIDDAVYNNRANADNQFTIESPYVQYAQHYGGQRLTSLSWYMKQYQAMPLLAAA